MPMPCVTRLLSVAASHPRPPFPYHPHAVPHIPLKTAARARCVLWHSPLWWGVSGQRCVRGCICVHAFLFSTHVTITPRGCLVRCCIAARCIPPPSNITDIIYAIYHPHAVRQSHRLVTRSRRSLYYGARLSFWLKICRQRVGIYIHPPRLGAISVSSSAGVLSTSTLPRFAFVLLTDRPAPARGCHRRCPYRTLLTCGARCLFATVRVGMRMRS